MPKQDTVTWYGLGTPLLTHIHGLEACCRLCRSIGPRTPPSTGNATLILAALWGLHCRRGSLCVHAISPGLPLTMTMTTTTAQLPPRRQHHDSARLPVCCSYCCCCCSEWRALQRESTGCGPGSPRGWPDPSPVHATKADRARVRHDSLGSEVVGASFLATHHDDRKSAPAI